jgi:alpha-amylase/alpha-mannosidase (GH57 family)
LFAARQIVTTTVTEYLAGNPSRNIPAHPIKELPLIEWLWPGSWINANYDTWIGDVEENKAWEYLLIARRDLEQSGLPQPDPKKKTPHIETKAWYAYRAWESMYAAEGSDWFWWYGTDQNAPSGDKPFDRAYITHLRNIYAFAKLAGAKMPERTFAPITQVALESVVHVAQGTMAQSNKEMVTVVFQCDAGDIYVRTSLFIVGNHELLGKWIPNKVHMYNDGTHGDVVAKDNVWSVEMQFPVGTELEYKFTNSGAEGSWNPGEEFAWAARKTTVTRTTSGKMFLFDQFGKL